VDPFDFVIAESCVEFDECGDYFAVHGASVFEVEYSDIAYRKACQDHGSRISVILRDHDVTPAGRPGYRYEHC
jgi:Glycoside-hydrolase family GH114